MEAHRFRGRHPRRGSGERPVNARLVRTTFLVVIPPLLLLLFGMSTPGALPRPDLEASFDGASAAELAARLSLEVPSRSPGTAEARAAADWVAHQFESYGVAVAQDVWSETLPGVGQVELRNVVATIPGESTRTIIVVASRDNAPPGERQGENASGTAALVELARSLAPMEAGLSPRPRKTFVFVSTDAATAGAAGAARFASTSPLSAEAVAVVVLNGIAGGGAPRLAIAGDHPQSAPPALVRTAEARIAEEALAPPLMPGLPVQLLDLAVPLGLGEQAPFLARSIPALAVTTEEPGEPRVPVGDPSPGVSSRQLERLGQGVQSLLASLDAGGESAQRARDDVYLGDRVIPGWTVRLLLFAATVPFLVGTVDLVVRARRRRLPLAPAVRAIRTRLAFWAVIGALLALAGLLGILPTGAGRPLSPYAPSVVDPDVAGLLLLCALAFVAWVVERRRLTPRRPIALDELHAGYAVGLAWLGIVAIGIAALNLSSLLFVLPSLYAWLWLPQVSSRVARATLLGVGLLGPISAIVLLARDLRLGLDVVTYVAGLVTVGYVGVAAVIVALAWAAAAAQLGALACGRYAPYADGAEPPPPGEIRRGVRALVRSQASDR